MRLQYPDCENFRMLTKPKLTVYPLLTLNEGEQYAPEENHRASAQGQRRGAARLMRPLAIEMGY